MFKKYLPTYTTNFGNKNISRNSIEVVNYFCLCDHQCALKTWQDFVIFVSCTVYPDATTAR